MRKLIDYLNKCTKAYDEGHPLISDIEYDNLYFKLAEMEKESGIIYPDSPTQHIYYEKIDSLKKVKHNHPLLSLDKTKNWNEFLQYFVANGLGKDVVGMPKLDGLTCSLQYIDGRLVSAATRGNGEIGSDILHNVRVMANVPQTIPWQDELVVDGEIICSYHDFEEFKDEFANPRNMAAGTISLLDSTECAKRKLQFVAWYVAKGPWDTVIDSFIGLDKFGFTVVPWTSSFDWDADDFLKNQAKELGYPIDGLVGRFNNIEFGKSLGLTGHHTKAAYAFKFYDESYPTTLRSIEWGGGRTGQLTPVAIFDEIEIEGSVVSRASLHNISIMRQTLGESPRVGDTVYVYKANAIIPQISDYDPSGAGEELEIPSNCPFCGEATFPMVENQAEILYCLNDNCPSKLINQLNHFLGKKGLDIKGISEATLEKLIDWGWVKTKSDLFNLAQYRDEWVRKPGFGVKSVDKMLAALEQGRRTQLAPFISSLGIPLIGSTVSKVLAEHFSSWNDFVKAACTGYKFYELPNFGIEMNNAIINYNYDEISDMVNKYIIFENPGVEEEIAAGDTLEGKTFVITGSVSRFKNRDELKKKIEALGGKVTGSVSKRTDYLINNDIESSSSKNQTAKNLNIPIISEENFIEIFGIKD